MTPAKITSSAILLFVLIVLIPTASHAADCTAAPPWDSSTAYSRNDRVTYSNDLWRAKRASENVTPGTHKPSWSNQGTCDSGPGDPPQPPANPTPIQIFGVWHAGNHYADWSEVQNMADFASDNDWLIHGNNGQPSVNLVVLSFLQPLDVLGMDPADPSTGVPAGMTMEVVNYFKNAGIRVMMSIGGITYTDFWDDALAADAAIFGYHAALIAEHFGVGIEIDYERNSNPDLTGLQGFIDAYRLQQPYNANPDPAPHGPDQAARLTIDLAAGGRYLQDLNRHATIHWLDNANPVLDYANAMVHRSSGTPSHWQEHVDGKPTYDPVIPPKAPNRFTGGLFLKGNMDNCTDFSGSEQHAHEDYVQTVTPNGAGTSNGMLGYMFWAAGTPSARKNYTPTTPPNSCEGGMGVAADTFVIPVPMEALRQN